MEPRARLSAGAAGLLPRVGGLGEGGHQTCALPSRPLWLLVGSTSPHGAPFHLTGCVLVAGPGAVLGGPGSRGWWEGGVRGARLGPWASP